MRFELRRELPQLLCLGLMWLIAASAWPITPEPMPVHWNAYGQVDGYGDRFMGLMLMPLLGTGFYVLLLVIPRIDPHRANYPKFIGAYTTLRTAVLGFMLVLHVILVGSAHGLPLNMNLVMPLLLGALLFALGPPMRRLERNWFAGLRTPWTLSSDVVWRKSHDFAGKAMIVAGLLVMLSGFLPGAGPVFGILVVILGMTVLLVGYSYVVWRREVA